MAEDQLNQPQQQRHAASHDITPTPTTKGRMPAGIVKKDRQRRRLIMSENSKQKVFAAALAATFLSDMYSGQHKSAPAATPWYSKQYHHRHSKLPIGSASSFDEMSERRSLEDRNTCLFRTKLVEEVEDEEFSDGTTSDFPTPGSTYDDLTIGCDIKFDDADCISVLRSPTMRGGFVQQRVSTVPADLISPQRDESSEPQDSMMIEALSFPTKFSVQSTSAKQGNGRAVATVQQISDSNASEEDLSEQVIMPFSVNPHRKARCRSSLLSFRAVDNDGEMLSDEDHCIIDDDMSIITDISMIPTYCPSDVMRQQHKIRAHTLLARLIKSKTNAAKKTVRQLKQSCRGVVESTFSESRNTYMPTKCIRVGEAF
ncbi:hypothetical protein QBC44DRAFT_89741 [Cladorrhinum sp. PSN332]|nr:hypothetical protein QBC44DRAFT_89741 [Cladorrhinum sp. PSN332]